VIGKRIKCPVIRSRPTTSSGPNLFALHSATPRSKALHNQYNQCSCTVREGSPCSPRDIWHIYVLLESAYNRDRRRQWVTVLATLPLTDMEKILDLDRYAIIYIGKTRVLPSGSSRSPIAYSVPKQVCVGFDTAHKCNTVTVDCNIGIDAYLKPPKVFDMS
jgi:hypothetical protein